MGPQYSAGVVEGVPFTACLSGSEIIILASDFTQVQKLSCPSTITSIDCSTDVGKVAASYENKMIIFEPQPQQSSPTKSPEYNWSQSAIIDSSEPITVISFNLDGSRIVTGGQTIQLWAINSTTNCWQRVWSCKTATSINFLKYSPDGLLFCSAGKSDRLVKIWHEIDSSFKFSFVYAVHPLPVTGVEWRRTSKYCPKGAVANVLLTSCQDNISRIWVQTLLQQPNQPTNWYSKPSLHLGGVIEADFEQFVTHWVNNKEILINRSIEILLHDMLVRILKGNNNVQTSSTNSPLSAGKSCSGSENDTDDLNDADDTITAESSKKLRHKLCRKMNKQRALAASGRQDLAHNITTNPDETSNHTSICSDSGTKSLVKEFDKTLELLLKKWQMTTDLIMSVNKSDGSLSLWQVKYLDGEDLGVYRQVQIEKLCCLESALPHYDATTMSHNISTYSPSAYLDVKRAYFAVTGSSNPNKANQFSPSDVLEILSYDNSNTTQPHDSFSSIESEPRIYLVTEHLSGSLGLWQLDFPNVRSIDLVSRVYGLPMHPSWLNDGILILKFDDDLLTTEWQALDQQESQEDSYKASDLAKSLVLPQYHTKQLVELLAFGKTKQVQDILNQLVNRLAPEIEGPKTGFDSKKAELLATILSEQLLPGLTNIDQMHLMAVSDAVALFDDDGSDYNPHMVAIDDKGLRFLTAMHQHTYLAKCLPMNQRNELKTAGIGSHNFIWAYHSETQDQLINQIPCVQRGKPEWSELREVGVGWWLRKPEDVKKLIEKVAQSAYQAKQEPLDAALFYLAMKKKKLVCALLRRVSGSDKRLLKLFEQDFNDPINRKKALKNAYALLGKHRFEHAAAFFILAGSIWYAVEVCINNLNDIQLAIILIRLHDSDTNLPENLEKLLRTEILDPARPAHKDAFLRSIAYWTLGDKLAAINTLLENDVSETRASVFSFYLHLKDQPLVKNRLNTSADKELELYFSTASAYLEYGCPLLALEVLSRLDTSRAMRMKFKAACLLILNQLNTLEPDQFPEWLRTSMKTLNELCSYKPIDDTIEEAWVEPILRAMLTYCNIHSSPDNSLSMIRLVIIDLLAKFKT